MHFPLFFEFIGTSELLVVMFVALILFGPRKLPELGRSLGQALSQLRDASNDFKRTWESETMLESAGGSAALTPQPSPSAEIAAAPEALAELAPCDLHAGEAVVS